VYIAVVGPGEATAVERATARDAGAGLAAAGCVVVCGGLGGVMEAACQGAREAGGLTVGILPGLDREAANPWVAVALSTGLGELRNGLVVRAADAVLAVGGAWGTLSEIALALKAGKRVVGVDTWRAARGGREVEGVEHVPDAAAAVAALATPTASRHEGGAEL
jgi:uncharacterized protein (TIGR00725 family)